MAPLTSGGRLGPYEIVALLGAGGMGEVYRATDTKLKRQVAIKILPPSLASDTDRLARFQREAEVLASLNHPNIAAIYGLEEAQGVTALVMELVEGEDLSQRIARGAIPIDGTLAIAKQIADALEAAHEQGIIHRDLKPANIKVRPDGTVKVLDFGLAKAMAPASAASANAMNSPTLSMHATQAGLILGTAAYMSPEQAAGKPVDKRSDLWAFGVVVLEMLTGRAVFTGETVSHVLASVLKSEPDWTTLPANTPAPLRRLLRRCLEKDRKRRLESAADARLDIEEALTAPDGAAEPRGSTPRSARSRTPWLVASVALLTTAALGAWVVMHLRQEPSAPSVMRFSIPPPEKATFSANTTNVVLSPDGRRVAFLAAESGRSVRLWVRPLDSLTSEPLAGTDDANVPFWSADSRYLAFRADGKLKKIAVAGGPPQILGDYSAAGAGGAWSPGGTILFAPKDQGPLFRVPAGGGTPEPVTTLDRGRHDTSHGYPSFLPDGRHFLYFALPTRTVMLGMLDSTEARPIVTADSTAIFATPGYLMFLRQDTLMAQPFDLKRLALGGEPVPVAQAVRSNEQGAGVFSVSDDGTLLFATGSLSGRAELAWFDRNGRQLETPVNRADWRDLDLSSDGRRIVAHRHEGTTGGDLWIFDSARATTTRLTFHASHNDHGVWSPDDTRIVFSSNRDDGRPGLFQKLATGASPDELLLKASSPIWPTDWSRDGRVIVYEADDPKTGRDIWLLPLDGDRKAVPYLRSEFNESHGQLSPDGRWMAYQSDESRTNQVYIQPVPPTGGKWQISATGGVVPRWRHDGKELFFIGRNRLLMAADTHTTGKAFEAGAPRELFQTRILVGVGGGLLANNTQYAVSPDGQRLLLATSPGEGADTPVTVVLHWAAGLLKK